MRTLIIGLGNPILTDDGVGVKVALLLEELIDLWRQDLTYGPSQGLPNGFPQRRPDSVVKLDQIQQRTLVM